LYFTNDFSSFFEGEMVGKTPYGYLFVASLVGLVGPAALALISYLFRQKKKVNDLKPLSFQQPPPPELPRHINTRYYIGLSIAGVSMGLILLLIPVAADFRRVVSSEKGLFLKSFFLLMSMMGLLMVSVFYSIKKGDVNWVHSLREDQD
tara:strand:+ start:3293 stop:3739 length:447 start_codon:yes stop_codon:yes gene_type:complete